jgi:hypothetical protein
MEPDSTSIENLIDRHKMVRWECLARYFSGKRGRILDMIFDNPLCEDGKRTEILENLNLTPSQREFLLGVFDIDYIYIQGKKPVLVEEKTKNIEGRKFHEGNYIYCNHGTSTQYTNLKKAYELGVQAGILLRCIKYKKKPKGLLGYALLSDGNVEFEDARFYPIQNCIHVKRQTKIPVDDFIKKMRTMTEKPSLTSSRGSQDRHLM